MPQNFIDLHIVDFCQLNCKHCYLNKGNSVMPLDMIRSIYTDFLKTALPLPQSTIILSGGDPLLHPNFVKACNIVRKLNGHVTMSTNGILIPKYVHTFQKNDGIQVSVDGDREAHDFIRDEGSYEKAVRALKLLDEHKIRHSIAFTTNQMNKHCVDHIIDLCVETGASTLNCNIYQPIKDNALPSIAFKEWIKIREYVSKKASGKRGDIFAEQLHRKRLHSGNTRAKCPSRWNVLGLLEKSKDNWQVSSKDRKGVILG